MPTNLGRMIERVRRNLMLSGAGDVPPAVIANSLQDAHHRVAVELQYPKRYIKNVDATQRFTLPTETVEGGLLYAELENTVGEPQVTIPIMSLAEANDVGIQWDVTDANLGDYRGHPVYGRYLIIYSPGVINAPVYPLGFEAGDTLRLLYTKVPAEMTELDDEPFDGLMEDYAGDMLVQYVTFEVMLARGMEQAQAFYNDYLQIRERAFQSTRPMPYLPRTNVGEMT